MSLRRQAAGLLPPFARACRRIDARSPGGVAAAADGGEEGRLKKGYDACGGCLRDFAVGRECEGAGAVRKPFDGENPFVE